MISKVSKHLGSTGAGTMYSRRGDLGIVQAGENLDKTAVGGSCSI